MRRNRYEEKKNWRPEREEAGEGEAGEGIKGVVTDGHGEGIWSRERPERELKE